MSEMDNVEINLYDAESDAMYKMMVSPEEAYKAESEEHSVESGINAQGEIEECSGVKWTAPQILLLIRLVEKYENAFQTGLKKTVWIKVANEISKTTGKHFTTEQVDNKWKGLKKTYKKIKDHNSKTGNNKKNWEYFNAMDSFMGKKPEIIPPAVCSSSSAEVTINNEESNESREEPCSSKFVSTLMKKRKRSENLAQQRHDEKMAKFDQFLNLFRVTVEHQTGKKID